MPAQTRLFDSVDEVAEKLQSVGYVTDAAIATSVFLAAALEKPILCEGPAGVGKTELAKKTAEALGLELIRLQCYEGLDEAKTLYEWKYPKQLLYTQMLRSQIGALLEGAADLGEASRRIAEHDDAFYSENFLQPRPLLAALRSDSRVVLLIDEVDRAEEELEAFFLEVLAEFQVTIPELGTIRARQRPLVFLTSNNTRELSDALRRRCLHLAVGFPTRHREAAIIKAHLPDLDRRLLDQLVSFVHEVRELELKKAPSVAEAIDWARSLTILCAQSLDPGLVETTLNVLLKHESDQNLTRDKLQTLLEVSAKRE